MKKRSLFHLFLGMSGYFVGIFLLVLFNSNVLRLIPLIPRMAAMIITYWLLAVIPVIIAIVTKEKPSDYGFTKDKMFGQVLIGVGLGLGMSLVLTLLPHLLGYGDWVDNGTRYTQLWQFIFEITYCVLAIAAVEELVFRGFAYKKIMDFCGKEYLAIVGSSILFGLSHIFNGNLIQVVLTSLIGMFWCICRQKIKNCTLISLIIAHGLYDFMITFWNFVF